MKIFTFSDNPSFPIELKFTLPNSFIHYWSLEIDQYEGPFYLVVCLTDHTKDSPLYIPRLIDLIKDLFCSTVNFIRVFSLNILPYSLFHM